MRKNKQLIIALAKSKGIINLYNYDYKMKCIKWYQKIKIFFCSWYQVLKNIRFIIKAIKKYKVV